MAFGLICADLVIEVMGGAFTHSLVLLADAGYMLTDVGGLWPAMYGSREIHFPIQLAKIDLQARGILGYIQSDTV